MSNQDIAISVNNVSKTFKLPHEQSSGLKQVILNVFRKNKKRGYEMQRVLNGVSFDIEKGDFFGIVGRNGSGKSTMLKLLAGIYVPDKGHIDVNGSLVPFIELGVGFNPELTGRENVYMNGALLGFSNKQMDEMYDEIVGFAELEKFMDQKLKNYSSGMQVRLAFSIAIRAEGDILVLDEVLAVGDEAFQRKCSEYFAKMKKANQTVVLVTHDMNAVRKYCNKAILIRGGEVVMSGSPDAIADEYSLDNLNSSNTRKDIKKEENSNKPVIKAEIVSSPILTNEEKLEVKITYKNTDSSPVYPKIVINYNNVPIMAANAKILYDIVTQDTAEHIVRYELPLGEFNKGEASIAALLVDSAKEVNLAEFGYDNELTFVVKNTKTGEKIGGIMRDLGNMELKR